MTISRYKTIRINRNNNNNIFCFILFYRVTYRFIIIDIVSTRARNMYTCICVVYIFSFFVYSSR